MPVIFRKVCPGPFDDWACMGGGYFKQLAPSMLRCYKCRVKRKRTLTKGVDKRLKVKAAPAIVSHA